MRYRFVIEDEVLDAFMRLPARRREQVFRHFQRLADEAPLPGDEDFQDTAGRWIMRRDFNSWTVWSGMTPRSMKSASLISRHAVNTPHPDERILS